ncbi:hypothetical protein [Candidatus Poriferisodalis sp.]|uniref:hypothetical protein n=1 Tax=Candidatus Poriferisodalis sp. TaxID=3101277 RepID=UPI003AF52656
MTTSHFGLPSPENAQIVFTVLNTLRKLHHVMGADYSREWWSTRNAELDSRTPSEAVIAGDHEAVARLVDSYLDPSFV